jgi:lipopolysaccharide transport system permease protein
MKRHYLQLVWYKALAELHAEAARAYLGFLWWIVEPLLYMSAFYIVFGLIFERGGPGFVPFLLCGLVVWKWFASSISSSANTIPANAALMQQVYLPKHLFPAIVLVINTIKFAVIFGLLLVFLLIYGVVPTQAWLVLPALVITQFLVIAAFAGVVAAVVPFVPDFRFILDNILMLQFFLSGIFFDINAVTGKLHYILQLNPMAVLIESYRNVLIDGQWPDSMPLAVILLGSLLGIGLAGAVLKHYDRIYPKVLV